MSQRINSTPAAIRLAADFRISLKAARRILALPLKTAAEKTAVVRLLARRIGLSPVVVP